MRRKLIALAVAGVASTAAMAQMNVTLYGNVDVAVIHASGTSSGTNVGAAVATGSGIDAAGNRLGSQTSMISGTRSATSKVGFKGSEALGSGLKASFVVETPIDASGNAGQAAPSAANAGLFGSYESSIGLEGDFGAVSFGRMGTGADYPTFDAAGDASPGSIQFLMYDQSNTRANNTIKYVTPSFSGFTGTYLLSMSENQGGVSTAATSTGTQTSLELTYVNGPLLVKLGQTLARDILSNAGALGTKFTLNNLGVAYDFGPARVSGQYVTQRNSTVGGAAATIDATTLQLGVKVPLDAHLISVNYVTTDDRRIQNADASSWYLGYDYALSKRTTAYLGSAWVSNKNGAGFSANSANISGGNLPAGRINAVFAGMNHTF